MLSEAKEKFDMIVMTTFYGLLHHTLWKFYHGHRWFVLVKKEMPSDKGWRVSKIKVHQVVNGFESEGQKRDS